MSESLNGVIERVTFHNPENGFCVLRAVVRGHAEVVTIIGTLMSVTPGEHFEAVGRWKIDRQHGPQFQAERIQTSPPASAAGIERYLASGAIRSVGPKLAATIVQQYKERTLDILDNHSDLLSHIQGIGPKRLKRIRESWNETREVRRIVLFLQEHGIGPARAVRIYRTYGHEAIDRIKVNPYCLADDIRGIGFRTADDLAQRIGIDPKSPHRVRAAVSYVLQELTTQGHTGCPESLVTSGVIDLVECDHEAVETAVRHKIDDQVIIRDEIDHEPWLYLAPLWHAENGIAQAVRRLMETGHEPLTIENLDQTIEAIELRFNISLARQQREAVHAACEHPLLVITGGPGVGKTTLVRTILEVFQSQGRRCVLAAPTGRAAKRLSETTGQTAKTLHRLLEFDPSSGAFTRNALRPLSGDLFVLDEVSMVDTMLGFQFLRAVPEGSTVVLVGDVDQLPSVGPGRVLGDLIDSRQVPVVRLTEVFRQAESSRIVQAAHAINGGRLPPLDAPTKELTDFYFIESADTESATETIVKLVRERIPTRFGLDPLLDVQILSPMKRGTLGTRQLNAVLQESLNPARTPTGQARPSVERFGTTFRVGDRVLQTENNYNRDVYNGDLGVIEKINEVEQEVTVGIEGRSVVYDFGDLDELLLAYALSIHKSQGSEYPCVIIPLHTEHFMMLQRNLLYTAVTRGKRLVIVVGTRRALELAIQRADTGQRYSALLDRLRRE
jgi:exodeoxyribonuclease V alpha subunit